MIKGTHYKTQEQFKIDVFDALDLNGTLQLGDSAIDFSECLDAWTQQGIDDCGVRFNTRVYPAERTIARWFRKYRARHNVFDLPGPQATRVKLEVPKNPRLRAAIEEGRS